MKSYFYIILLAFLLIGTRSNAQVAKYYSEPYEFVIWVDSTIKQIEIKATFPKDSDDIRAILDTLSYYNRPNADLFTHIYTFDGHYNVLQQIGIDKDTVYKKNFVIVNNRKTKCFAYDLIDSSNNYHTTFDYDSEGRMISERRQFGNGYWYIEYTHNKKGNLIKSNQKRDVYGSKKHDYKETSIHKNSGTTSLYKSSMIWGSGDKSTYKVITEWLPKEGIMKEQTISESSYSDWKNKDNTTKIYRNGIVETSYSESNSSGFFSDHTIDTSYYIYDTLKNVTSQTIFSWNIEKIKKSKRTRNNGWNYEVVTDDKKKGNRTLKVTLYTYEYVYDTHNNWIKKSFYENGILIRIIERKITYFE